MLFFLNVGQGAYMYAYMYMYSITYMYKYYISLHDYTSNPNRQWQIAYTAATEHISAAGRRV